MSIVKKSVSVDVFEYNGQNYPTHDEALKAGLGDLLGEIMFHNCDSSDVAEGLIDRKQRLLALLGNGASSRGPQ